MEYKIIAADDHVYGPIDGDTLRSWVTDKRVAADTWVFETTLNRWIPATKVVSLSELFLDEQPAGKPTPVEAGNPAVRPGQLRRLKVLADMSEEQLAKFVELVEKVQVRMGYIVVKQNEQGDCMYLLLDGEVRVRQMPSGRETTLAVLETGDFFGEICLFDEGPRSADVVANKDCTLLKIAKQRFHEIMDQHPEIAVRFLFAIIRTVEARIRTHNKRYSDSMTVSRSYAPMNAALASATAAAAAGRPRSQM